jgi:hypothetical protein
MLSVASVNCPKTRDVPGANGIGPVAVRKTERVGVVPPSQVSDNCAAGVARHCPVAGPVSQIGAMTGKIAAPVLTAAATVSDIPIFGLATANAPVPPAGISAIPLFVGVAEIAIMSAVGPTDVAQPDIR